MTDQTPPRPQPAARSRQRKQMLLRLDPAVHDALARWASDELRSANAQIEFLLRRALAEAGRLPGTARPIARRGRPPRQSPEGPENRPEAPPGPGTGTPRPPPATGAQDTP
ncbi:hypothetical protein GTY83_13645 [Streptomyces sp. SID4928]|uniref:hypothetical protein n=1 Tax=Streptomyces TaxID=1883 RepID=UPI000203473A|nr:hypothetical protein [Streptomyces sp. ACT-1]EGE42097.1 hypothetical protein SACT1_2755 [Streptomyces sp. ACT-1]MYR50147.1 hypothetical protein [Streptomyces sp. SID4928]